MVIYALPEGPNEVPVPSGQLRHDLADDELSDPQSIVGLIEQRLQTLAYEPKRGAVPGDGVTLARWMVDQG